eukprot:215490-Rhodomonas_salina.3
MLHSWFNQSSYSISESWKWHTRRQHRTPHGKCVGQKQLLRYLGHRVDEEIRLLVIGQLPALRIAPHPPPTLASTLGHEAEKGNAEQGDREREREGGRAAHRSSLS